MPSHDLHAARIVAGTLTLLSREIREVGRPVDLWSPALTPDFIREAAARVGRGEAAPLWVDERHPARGLMIYACSPWESEVFGFGCARLSGPFMVVEGQRDRETRVRRLARLAIERGRADERLLMTIKTFHDPAVLRGFMAEDFVLAEIGASLSGPVPEEEISLDRPAGFLFLEETDRAELTDEIVAGLGDFFYDGHYRHDSSPGPEAARRMWSLVLKNDLSGEAKPVVVLWDRKKDRVAGLATVHLNGHAAHLNIMAVTPPYQGRGLSGLILGEALNRLRALGVTTLSAETASYNLPALGLYHRLGLKPTTPLAAFHYHY